jgi:hypothetical protein
MTGSFDASENLQQLEKLNLPSVNSHWIVSSPAAMINYYFAQFHHMEMCYTKSDTQPALPAPSAPPVACQSRGSFVTCSCGSLTTPGSTIKSKK